MTRVEYYSDNKQCYKKIFCKSIQKRSDKIIIFQKNVTTKLHQRDAIQNCNK